MIRRNRIVGKPARPGGGGVGSGILPRPTMPQQPGGRGRPVGRGGVLGGMGATQKQALRRKAVAKGVNPKAALSQANRQYAGGTAKSKIRKVVKRRLGR